MLVLIFGIWMNVAQVKFLQSYDDQDCRVVVGNTRMGGAAGPIIEGRTCDEVAAEINKAVKAQE